MKEKLNTHNNKESNTDDNEEEDEKKLMELIKEAGDDMRKRGEQTMKLHFDKLNAVCKEAMKNREIL